jgi:hypothetical protein
MVTESLTELSVSGCVSKNGNPLDDSFLSVFEHAELFGHLFSFMLRQIIMGSRAPGNENPHRVPGS